MALPVEPNFVNPALHVEDDLARGGVPATDATWLAKFLVSRAYSGSSVDEASSPELPDLLLLRLDRPMKTVINAFANETSRHASLFKCLLSLPTISPRYLFDGSPQPGKGGLRDRSEWSKNTDLVESPQTRIRRRSAVVLRVLREFLRKEHNIDFNEGLASYTPGTGQVDLGAPIVLVASRLLWSGRVDPTRFLELEKVIGNKPETWNSAQPSPSPVKLEFWFDAAAELRFQAWPAILKFMVGVPDEKLGAFALAAYKAFHYWLWGRSRNGVERVQRTWIFHYNGLIENTPQPDAQTSQDYSKALRAVARHLGERLEKRHDDAILRSAWWAYSWRGYLGREKLLSDDVRKALVGSATEFLGRMRGRDGAIAKSDAAAMVEQQEQYELALRTVAAFGSLFRCVKALLLTLRSLKVPCIAPDLRYWYEEGRDIPPKPWSWIPEKLTAFTHTYARYEGKKDPDLKGFREELVQYCLDRLKSKPEAPRATKSAPAKAEYMIESSAAWRYACVRAIRELGTKPRDRGRAVLKWASESDPDESVRTAARVAYDELLMPDATAEPERKSTRRGIFAAYWWMRQAHLDELRVAIDKQGANRTFRLEVRRTHAGGEVGMK